MNQDGAHPLHWVAAGVGPLVLFLASYVHSGFHSGHALRLSSIDVEREAVNVAGMATRDLYAATQDKNPHMALVHVTSAQAYMTAARRIMSDDDLSLAINTNVRTVANEIEELQRRVTGSLRRKRQTASRRVQ